MAGEVVLVVDDDKDIADLIEVHLEKEGYKVLKAYDGGEALRKFRDNEVHLVLLDIMMPQLDGIEACRQIREKSNIPIILLSAKSTDIDKVIGLSTGADDYIVKPFSTIELIARVKAQLRRFTYLNNKNTSKKGESIEIKGLKIYYDSRSVTVYGKEVKLTKTEYDILLLMAQNLGRVFTLEEIFERVWGERYFEGNNTVMVHIARLREKIEDNPKDSQIIKNVWGVGYKIEN